MNRRNNWSENGYSDLDIIFEDDLLDMNRVMLTMVKKTPKKMQNINLGKY